jgi:hypothetical protein
MEAYYTVKEWHALVKISTLKMYCIPNVGGIFAYKGVTMVLLGIVPIKMRSAGKG